MLHFWTWDRSQRLSVVADPSPCEQTQLQFRCLGPYVVVMPGSADSVDVLYCMNQCSNLSSHLVSHLDDDSEPWQLCTNELIASLEGITVSSATRVPSFDDQVCLLGALRVCSMMFPSVVACIAVRIFYLFCLPACFYFFAMYLMLCNS